MHNGGSDSLSIANAARFAISNWGVDANRVFAVGTSSGAMMTSVLAGAYPDVFKAGIVDSGVAFGCFAVPGQPDDSWNSQCSEGQLILTGAQWVYLSRDCQCKVMVLTSVFNRLRRSRQPSPASLAHTRRCRSGTEPRTLTSPNLATPLGLILHCSAPSDTTLFPQNFFEEIKQWTTVFGYPSSPISNITEAALPRGYSNSTFGPNFQAILAQGVGHTVPLFEQQYLEFLGIA